MDCIRRHNGKCGGRTTCPFHTFLERAVYCHDFVPDDHDPCIRTSMMEREAAWADVKAKGEAIVAAGGVEILEDNPAYVEALVMSGDVAGSFPVYDGGPYRVILSKTSWENKSNVGGWLQGYLCECFVPGTLITMSDGSVKPIEDIEEGDMVLSGEGISRRISHTMNRHHVGNVRKIKLHGFAETITCTDNHPFWAIEKIRCDRCESHNIHPYNCKNTHSGKTPPRWIKSCELKPGMHIQKRAIDGEGEWVRIESIDDFDYDGQVFNLEVENDHTYLANGFKVHNCKWGSYHSGEPGPGYQGRFCSHAYAAMLVADMRARKDFINDRRASMTAWGDCAECGEHDLVSLTTGLCDRCGEKTVFTSMAKAMFGTASQRRAAEEELTKADDSVIEDIEDNMEVEERGDISIARWHGHQAVFSRCASNKVAWQDETLYEVAVSANGIDIIGSVHMTEFGHLYAYWNGESEEFTEQPDWNPTNRHDEIDAAVDWVVSQANEFAETISEFDPKITVTMDNRYALDRFGSVDSPTPVYDAQQRCYVYRDYYYIYEPDGEEGWWVDCGGEHINPIDDSLEGCIEVCDEIIESEYGGMDEFVRRESMRGKFANHRLAYKEGDTFTDEDGNMFSITKVTFEGEIEGEDFFEYDVINQDGEALTFTNTDLDYMRKIGNRKTATRQFTYAEMQELEDEVKDKPYLNNADRLKEPDACMFY